MEGKLPKEGMAIYKTFLIELIFKRIQSLKIRYCISLNFI